MYISGANSVGSKIRRKNARSGAPAEPPGTWPRMSINSQRSQNIRSTLLPKPGDASTLFEKSKGTWVQEICIPLRDPELPYRWWSRRNEEAQVHVHDLDLFVAVQLLENTPAVLSKLCKGHGYTCEWPSGSEPRLTKNGKNTSSRTENFVPLVVPGASSSTSSSSTSPPQDYSLHPANSRSNEEVTGNCTEEVAGNCSESTLVLPEDFTENLEITATSAALEISHDSDPERPRKVASRKHSIDNHFPKKRNYEVCKRNKITRASCRDALVFKYIGQRSLVTWLQPITKSSTKDVNLGTIIDTQSLYKFQPLNGYNRTHSNQKLLRKRKELTEVLGADVETKSHLHWQFLRIWQRLWRIIMESSYTWYCWKSGTQNRGRNVCCVVAIGSKCGRKNAGPILWNAMAISEMFKTSSRTGKHPLNGDLE